MRTIKFCGKRIDNGEWITGNLFTPNKLVRGIYICPDTTYADFYPEFEDGDNLDDVKAKMSGITLGHFHEVHPDSVGQFTELLDKNGKEIFDGDILKVGTKHGFNSELLEEFKNLNNLTSLNGIGLHFTGIVRIDLLRGLMFENTENNYREPMFSRHIKILRNHSEIEIIGNIYENKELLK